MRSAPGVQQKLLIVTMMKIVVAIGAQIDRIEERPFERQPCELLTNAFASLDGTGKTDNKTSHGRLICLFEPWTPVRLLSGRHDDNFVLSDGALRPYHAPFGQGIVGCM